jgi:hypothetical protein
MTPDERECIEFLRNHNTPESDLVGWVDCAGTLLLVEAVPELTKLLLNERYSFATREHTARTIRILGSLDVSKLRINATPELNRLLDIVDRG